MRRRNARAFTLLETMLAAAIGSVAALAALGMFLAIDKTDAVLAARYRQSVSLERAHRVLSRAFLSLVTSDRPRPPTRPNPSGTGSANRGAAGTGAAASGNNAEVGGRASAFSEETSSAQPPSPPARVRLSLDPSMSGRGMARPGGGAFSTPVQMFEMVVHTAPAGGMARPTRASAESGDESLFDETPERREAAQDGTDRDAPRLMSPTGRIYRGAFVLRPSQDAVDGGNSGETPHSWGLWWQPLPPAREDGNPPGIAEIAAAGAAVQVAAEIASMRWQVYDDRVRKQDYSGVWARDLPAYVEVELVTTAGLWANWMFEVAWVDGSEPSETPTDEESDRPTDGGATPTYPASKAATPRK